MLLALAAPSSYASEYTVVNAPLSPVVDGDVHSIPVGSIVKHLGNGITEVYDKNNDLLLRARDNDCRQIPEPAGKMASVTHVHRVPSGSHINEEDGIINIYSEEGVRILTIVQEHAIEANLMGYEGYGTVKRAGMDFSVVVDAVVSLVDREPNSDNTNPLFMHQYFGPHIEYTYDNSIEDLGHFLAMWDVPLTPPDPRSDTTIYLWNGIQNDYEDPDILQPVLAYRESTDWYGECVYGINNTFIHSDPIDADEGDEIWGNVYWDPLESEWVITIINWDTIELRNLMTSAFDYDEGVDIFCDLEGWNVWNEDDLPGDTLFYDMEVKDTSQQDIDIEWSAYINPGYDWNLEGLDVDIISDSSVELETYN